MNEVLRYFEYSKLEPLYIVSYKNKIWNFLSLLVLEYPGFRKWFENLFNSDYSIKSDREIILCCDNNIIAGVTILKNSPGEKKICTLKVDKNYRNMGIGKNLIIKSFEVLQTDEPLITVRSSKNEEFDALFRYFDFHLEQKMFGYYKLFGTEYVYNGYLPAKERNNILRIKDDIEQMIKAAISKGNYLSDDFILRLCINMFVDKPLSNYEKVEFLKMERRII